MRRISSAACLDRLISTIKIAHESQLTPVYGFPAMSLELKVGLAANLDEVMTASRGFELNEALIPSRGDSNCYLRTCIQALLLRGITVNKKQEVADFLRGVYDRNAEAVLLDSKCTLQMFEKEFGEFVQGYTTGPLSLENLVNNYFPHDIITASGALETANPPDEQDKYCYFLAACLRFDMVKFAKTTIATPDGTAACADLFETTDSSFSLYDFMRIQGCDLQVLQTDVDIQATLAYWSHYKVQLVTSMLQTTKDSRGVSKPERWTMLASGSGSTGAEGSWIRIDINQATNHFDVRIKPSIDGLAVRPTFVPSEDTLIRPAGTFSQREKGAHRLVGNEKHSTPQHSQDWTFLINVLSNPITSRAVLVLSIAGIATALVALGVLTAGIGVAIAAVAMVLAVASHPGARQFVGGFFKANNPRGDDAPESSKPLGPNSRVG